MKKFLKQYIKVSCEVYVEEENLIEVLTMCDQCGLKSLKVTYDKETEWLGGRRWLVSFYAHGGQQAKLRRNLMDSGITNILMMTSVNSSCTVVFDR